MVLMFVNRVCCCALGKLSTKLTTRSVNENSYSIFSVFHFFSSHNYDQKNLGFLEFFLFNFFLPLPKGGVKKNMSFNPHFVDKRLTPPPLIRVGGF